MAITVYTEEEWFNYAIAAFGALPQFSGADLSEYGFLGLEARAIAQLGALVSLGIKDADDDGVPAYDQDADGNIRSRCSRAALEAWAFTFGLPNGAGGFGSRGPTISTGGSGIPSGTAATFVPSGSTAVDSTGRITVQTTADVTLTVAPNTASVPFVSVTTGAAANLPKGSLLTWVAPPPGLAAQVTLTTALVGAEDTETDTELVARLLERIQNPPRGGVAADYRFWTENSVNVTTLAALGIRRAYVYPQRSGLGSVDVVPLVAGTTGPTRIPGATTRALVQTYVNTKRPVTATVYIREASAAAANALRIRIRLLPSTAKGGVYLFDWIDGGTPTTITAHTANTITVGAVPAALSAAFASGSQPRVQVIISTSGASAAPFLARVSNIVGLVITLDTSFDIQPTDAVDYFWAGGGAVDAVADRILDYSLTLGPSRQSGFADEYDVWETDVTLARLTDIVMETKDTDGTRMISDIPNLASTGVTIAVGAGAFAPNSYTPRDSFAGIELPYLRAGGIEILQG